MTTAVRVIHGSSAALVRALATLTQTAGVQATPSFGQATEAGSEIQFISVRVEDSEDWDDAAARVESILNGEVEFILTTDDQSAAGRSLGRHGAVKTRLRESPP